MSKLDNRTHEVRWFSDILSKSNGTESNLEGGFVADPEQQLEEFYTEHLDFDTEEERKAMHHNAQDVLRKFRDNPNPEYLNQLEALVFPGFRPVLDVKNDQIASIPSAWPALRECQDTVKQTILATGRIEVMQHPRASYGGTGFIVADDLVMTNRHVAELFTRGVGCYPEQKLSFWARRGAGWSPRREIGLSSDEERTLNVERIELVHPHLDVAILRVEGLKDLKYKPLSLMSQTSSFVPEGRTVAVVGYPAYDSRNPLKEQSTIYRNTFDVKRLAVGLLRGQDHSVGYQGERYPTLLHDCSTLGGNSGSAVMDLRSGLVVGLHFSGLYRRHNISIPSWELAKDQKIRDLLGDVFVPSSTMEDDPYQRFWNIPVSSSNGDGGAEPVVTTVRELGLRNISTAQDFLELDEQEQIRLWEKARSEIEVLLKRDLGSYAQISLDALQESSQNRRSEYPFLGSPEQPEIILIPGLMGSHLAYPTGWMRRLWLSFTQFGVGDVLTRMGLNPDGLTDEHPPGGLSPDGVLQSLYGVTALYLRAKAFKVHIFSYDWRKSVRVAADRLHHFIEQLALDRPNKKWIIVAHSMGGVVSALYSSRHSVWKERIIEAFMLGSPLHGSFQPISAMLGQHSFFNRLARLIRLDDPEELRALSCRLPGLIDLLPDPDTFPQHQGILNSMYETEHWEQAYIPTSSHLEHSLALKNELRNAPILQHTTAFVSNRYPTLASVALGTEGAALGSTYYPGDGTVPTISAVPRAVKTAYEASYSHMMLPVEKEVLSSIAGLILSGTCQLSELNRDVDVLRTHRQPDSQNETITDIDEALYERVQQGNWTLEDLEWLFEGRNMRSEIFLE